MLSMGTKQVRTAMPQSVYKRVRAEADRYFTTTHVRWSFHPRRRPGPFVSFHIYVILRIRERTRVGGHPR
jgi:hypothetical protein